MTSPMNATRREVLRTAGIFGTLFLARGISACFTAPAPNGGGSSSSGGSLEGTGSADEELLACAEPVIEDNHGHSFVVPVADVEAGVKKTYSIQGDSDHDHRVTITAAGFAELAAGRSITLDSSEGAEHAHAVTVSCPDVGGSSPDEDDAGPGKDAGKTTKDAGAGEDAAATDAGTDSAAPAVRADGATASAISSNHGHALVVASGDVAAGAKKTYSIKGTSGHDHQVTIESADFAKLKNGETLTLTSTTGSSHTHTVKVICA